MGSMESKSKIATKKKIGEMEERCHNSISSSSTPHVKLKVGDTECPLQVCLLSRSSESTHFRSFVEMQLYSFPPKPGIASEIGGTCLRSTF